MLLRSAPHIMRPLHFIMPYAPHLRPAWMIRAGLFLYDHLAQRSPSRRLRGRSTCALTSPAPPQERLPAWLRVLRRPDRRCAPRRAERARCPRARCRDPDAHPLRAAARRTPAAGARRSGRRGTRADRRARRRERERPLGDRFVAGATPVRTVHRVRLVKGSHIVVPRLFAIASPTSSRTRIAASYSRSPTSVTSRCSARPTSITRRPGRGRGSTDEELEYLCALANRYFRPPISAGARCGGAIPACGRCSPTSHATR